MDKYSEKLYDIQKLLGRLQKQVPKEIEAFKKFSEAVEVEGELQAKQKNLINIALAVAAQCEWCISLHVKEALTNGATEQEIIEAGMQAVLMHGGPALMYMIPLEEAVTEFLKVK